MMCAMEANQGRAVRAAKYWVPRFRGNDRGSAEMTAAFTCSNLIVEQNKLVPPHFLTGVDVLTRAATRAAMRS